MLPLPSNNRLKRCKRRKGFTLAELLIALAILGVIATFTIPKVLQAQQDGRNNAIAKEAAGALSTAFTAYKLQGKITSNTTSDDIMSRQLNYVRVDTTSQIDSIPGQPSRQCGSNGDSCYLLQNGAMVMTTQCPFFTSAPQGMVDVYVDPSGSANGSPSVMFWIHTNGKLETIGTISAGSYSSPACWDVSWNANPSDDAPWFHWN